MFKYLKNDWHVQLLLISIGVSLLPVILFVVASVLGWYGYTFGYLIEMIFFFSWPVVVVYLLTVLAVDRPPARITAIYSLLLVLCVGGTYWGVYAHPFLTEFEHRLKRVYNNVPALQKWAVGVMDSHKDQIFIFRRRDYPAWIKNKNFPEPFIRVSNQSEPKYEMVELMWDCGLYGSFGLAVGKPGLPKQGRKWADGVYFFVQPRPYGWRE